MSAAPLVIVLSSYNGSRFIAQQIDSIRRQSLSDWTLIVRDDGSSDDTVEVVESLAKLDRRIELLHDRRGNLGPAASFGLLLEHARDIRARYVALADQDDVWRPGKLAAELELLRAREGATATVPLLVHSDLAVVREDLSVIHHSFLTHQKLRHPPDSPLSTLLIQNFVTGCTIVINRPLLEAAVPLPQVIMHDWWLALCAAALGQVVYLPEATVLYRQHERNVQGSKGWRASLRQAMRRPLTWWSGSALMLQRAVGQADELRARVEREGAHTPNGQRSLQVLQELCSAFATGGPLARLRAVYRHRIRPRTLLPYPVPFYLRVVLWRLGAVASAPPQRASDTDGTRQARA